MATKKKTTTKSKTTKKASKPVRTVEKRQLPSPLTPVLAVVSLVFTYLSFSLAIDSGSYWHYGFGFYFIYQTVRLTKLSVRMRLDDKTKRASKA